jgi:hypothetical protein
LPTESYQRGDWPSKSFRRTATEIVSLREREITARRDKDALQPLPRRPGCQASEETEMEGGLRIRGDATAFAPPMIPGGRQPRRTVRAMNPKSGCSYWTFQANGPMQSAPRVSNARVWRCRPGGSPCSRFGYDGQRLLAFSTEAETKGGYFGGSAGARGDTMEEIPRGNISSWPRNGEAALFGMKRLGFFEQAVRASC